MTKLTIKLPLIERIEITGEPNQYIIRLNENEFRISLYRRVEGWEVVTPYGNEIIRRDIGDSGGIPEIIKEAIAIALSIAEENQYLIEIERQDIEDAPTNFEGLDVKHFLLSLKAATQIVASLGRGTPLDYIHIRQQ